MTAKTVLFMAILGLSTCFGQSERGAITGMVTDSTNPAIPSAPVKLTHMGTNASTSVMSSATGQYSVANLAPGAYRVEVSHDGSRTSVINSVVLTAGATARRRLELRTGGGA